ncbi:MAG TPA: SEC-C metal-binding domain-containing protein, partial [Polyangiaceae bacterium]|nr:SEC-C metal-binding domain-containing protein [Polyangiaceae bacterium]
RLLDLIDRVMSAVVEESCPENKPPEDWDWKSIHDAFAEHFRTKLDKEIDNLGDAGALVRELFKRAEAVYVKKEKALGVDLVLRVFRHIYLETIDESWVDHLSSMEHLRDGIGLRGYGQRDPKNEYKKEGYNLFLNMMAKVSGSVVAKLFEVQIHDQQEIAELEHEAEARHQAELEAAVARHPGNAGPAAPESAPDLNQLREQAASMRPSQRPTTRQEPKVGRNDLCPCGSGQKFKKCHGALLDEEDEPPQPQV